MSEQLPAVSDPVEIAVPWTGEIVPLADAPKVAHALEGLRDYKAKLDEARAVLEAALVEESKRLGTKTLHLGSIDAEVYGGAELLWDMEELEKLREAGLPEERFTDLVRPVVTYKVDARVAKQLESANERYAEIIERARSYVERPPRVRTKRLR